MKIVDSKMSAIGSSSAGRLGRLLAIPALLLGLSVLPAVAEDGGCTDASLRGDYGYAINATSITIPPAGPLSILGKITVDGRGNFSGSATANLVGVVLPDLPISGTYSVASDCTGTFTTTYPAFTAHFKLVLVEGPNGCKRAELLATDGGTVGTGAIDPVGHERF